MVDVNPAIFDNPTLGQAANGVFLDVLTAQQDENRRAGIEGREPRILTRVNNHPNVPVDICLPSMDNGIRFADVETPTSPPTLPLPDPVPPEPEPEPEPLVGRSKARKKAPSTPEGCDK